MSNKKQVLAVLNDLISGSTSGPKPTSTAETRKEQMLATQKRASRIASLLATPLGYQKLGAALTNPVLQHLDYEGISRYFLQTETIPAGVPFIYNWDLPAGYAALVADGGNSRKVIMRPRIVEIQPFDIVSQSVVITSDLFDARFSLLDRAKDRVAEAMRLREDLYSFSLMGTVAGAAAYTTASVFDKKALAKTFRPVEQVRLNVAHILGHPAMIEQMRRWQYLDLDQPAMQEMRQAGYLGEFWGSQIWVNEQITATNVYTISTPEFTGWLPIRKEVTLTVEPVARHNRIYVSGYERIGMTWYNNEAVALSTFVTTA